MHPNINVQDYQLLTQLVWGHPECQEMPGSCRVCVCVCVCIYIYIYVYSVRHKEIASRTFKLQNIRKCYEILLEVKNTLRSNLGLIGQHP